MIKKWPLIALMAAVLILSASPGHTQAVDVLLREKRLEFFAATNAAIWTNMPAAETEILGSPGFRLHTDLNGYAEFRLLCYMITASNVPGAYIKLQYSRDNVAFLDAEAVANTGRHDLTVDNTMVVGSWAALASGAKQVNTYLRLAGVGGNGVADPGMAHFSVEFRD